MPVETAKFFLPLILVFLSFVTVVAAYCVLAVNGTPTGPLEELAIGLGGAVGALAAPAVAFARPLQPPSQ